MTMQQFLKEIEIYAKDFSSEAQEFYNNLIDKEKQSIVTENGAKILKCMRENKDKYLNVFSSKQLGELLFMPPRSVSGSIKKLLNDGYAEKRSTNPVTYGLTAAGEELQLD